jgi:hypothetical protein
VQLPQERSWWSRNWKWFVPAGCLSALILAGVVVAVVVFLILGTVFGHIKSSDVYQRALAEARANPTVVNALGAPIKDGRFPSGSLSTSGSSGTADLSIPLSGPKGKGTLYAVATRSAGEWSFSQLAVTIKATGQRIDLLGGTSASLSFHSRAWP